MKIKQKDEEYKNELERIKNEYENKLTKKNENEITIIYKISKEDEFIKIFDKDFVENNKNYCKIYHKEREYELQENFILDEETKSSKIFQIKLKFINQITSFYSMFYDCTALLNLPDISKLDTSNITSLGDMFAGCSSLVYISDISNWNTSKVRSFSEMFYGCSSLSFLPDISKWDTSNVTKMNKMFFNCSSLLYLPDISKWNTSNVTKMNEMFKNCSSLLSLPDISRWDITNVETREDMFQGCNRDLIISINF